MRTRVGWSHQPSCKWLLGNANSFLVTKFVPHKTPHGTISNLTQRPKLAANVGKTGAVKNKMSFIPQCPGPAQSAAAEMPGDGEILQISPSQLLHFLADQADLRIPGTTGR